MSSVGEFTAIGKLVFDLAKNLRDVLAKRSKHKTVGLDVSNLIEAYGLLSKLVSFASRLQALAESSQSDPIDAWALLDSVSHAVHRFSQVLSELNVALIGLYQPKLASALAEALGDEIETFQHLEEACRDDETLRAAFKLPKIAKTLENLVRTHNAVGIGLMRVALDARIETTVGATSAEHKAELGRLAETLQGLKASRDLFGEMMKASWDLKTLSSL